MLTFKITVELHKSSRNTNKVLVKHRCKHIFKLRDAQLNMDMIEKRVSGNERVHNWWVVWADPE